MFLSRAGYFHSEIDSNFGRISVRALQRFLQDHGEDPGPIDGDWGSLTSSALQRFLKYNKVEGEGKCTYHQDKFITGGSHGSDEVTITVGVSRDKSWSSRFESSLSSHMEASVTDAVTSLSAGVSASIRSEFAHSVSVHEFREETHKRTINWDRPCYIYQLICDIPTRFGTVVWKGSEVILDYPLE